MQVRTDINLTDTVNSNNYLESIYAFFAFLCDDDCFKKLRNNYLQFIKKALNTAANARTNSHGEIAILVSLCMRLHNTGKLKDKMGEQTTLDIINDIKSNASILKSHLADAESRDEFIEQLDAYDLRTIPEHSARILVPAQMNTGKSSLIKKAAPPPLHDYLVELLQKSQAAMLSRDWEAAIYHYRIGLSAMNDLRYHIEFKFEFSEAICEFYDGISSACHSWGLNYLATNHLDKALESFLSAYRFQNASFKIKPTSGNSELYRLYKKDFYKTLNSKALLLKTSGKTVELLTMLTERSQDVDFKLYSECEAEITVIDLLIQTSIDYANTCIQENQHQKAKSILQYALQKNAMLLQEFEKKLHKDNDVRIKKLLVDCYYQTSCELVKNKITIRKSLEELTMASVYCDAFEDADKDSATTAAVLRQYIKLSGMQLLQSQSMIDKIKLCEHGILASLEIPASCLIDADRLSLARLRSILEDYVDCFENECISQDKYDYFIKTMEKQVGVDDLLTRSVYIRSMVYVALSQAYFYQELHDFSNEDLCYNFAKETWRRIPQETREVNDLTLSATIHRSMALSFISRHNRLTRYCLFDNSDQRLTLLVEASNCYNEICAAQMSAKDYQSRAFIFNCMKELRGFIDAKINKTIGQIFTEQFQLSPSHKINDKLKKVLTRLANRQSADAYLSAVPVISEFLKLNPSYTGRALLAQCQNYCMNNLKIINHLHDHSRLLRELDTSGNLPRRAVSAVLKHHR